MRTQTTEKRCSITSIVPWPGRPASTPLTFLMKPVLAHTFPASWHHAARLRATSLRNAPERSFR